MTRNSPDDIQSGVEHFALIGPSYNPDRECRRLRARRAAQEAVEALAKRILSAATSLVQALGDVEAAISVITDPAEDGLVN